VVDLVVGGFSRVVMCLFALLSVAEAGGARGSLGTPFKNIFLFYILEFTVLLPLSISTILVHYILFFFNNCSLHIVKLKLKLAEIDKVVSMQHNS